MLNLISWSCKIYEFLSRILNIFFEDHYFLRLFHFLIENILFFYYKRLLSQLLIASLARKENSPLRFNTVLVAIVLTTESPFF